MNRIAYSLTLSVLLFLTSVNTSASAPTPASPDTISMVVEKAEISSDDLTFIPIFDGRTDPVELTSTTNPIFGQKDQIPVGAYRVLRLTIKSISWHATWSLANPSNPSPCDGATSGEASGTVELSGHTEFYFKTPDLGGNTLAYYQASVPPSPSIYVGDANHPFVLASPVNVTKDKVTAVNLVIGVDHTLTCDAVGIYDRTASDNAVPLRMLSGPATRLNGLEGAKVDSANDEIGTTNSGNESVTIYHRADTGDVSPLRTLIGPNTRLNDPNGVVLYQDPVDHSQGEIIVANQGNDSLTVYSRSATGNINPLRTIVGLQTGLSRPTGIALHLDPTGNPALDEVFVANQGNDSLTVYGRTATENTTPLRMISGQDSGLSSPCGIYVDEKNDEIGVANSGGDTVTIYNRMDTGNAVPKRTITGLSSPCGIYVDTENDEIGVANSGADTVTIYNRMDTGNAVPKRTITGLTNPRALYLDSTHGDTGEIGVVRQGSQAVMEFVPSIFPSSANEAASNSILSGDYNVMLYGVDIKGMTGHGSLVPVVFAERGTATFDPTTSPWPDFSLSLDTQIRRQIIAPDCPTEPDFGNKKFGHYGVNDNGSFYAFLSNTAGSLQGGFLPDGSAFVASMVDSSNKLLLVYGVKKSIATSIPYLTSDGTSTGGNAYYSFTSYSTKDIFINRFKIPPTDDLIQYMLTIGVAETSAERFIGESADKNFVTILNPAGDLAAPGSPGPNYQDGGESSLNNNYTLDIGGAGLLKSPLTGLAGAVDRNGATLIYMRNTATKDDFGCPTDIGFGMGLRQNPSRTFQTGSLKGTYFLTGFGDRYRSDTHKSLYRSTAATLAFDGNGNAEIDFIENEMGIIAVDQEAFRYRVVSRTIPNKGDTSFTVRVVDIFDRFSTGPYASALIGNNGQTLAFFKNLNPGGDPNGTRLLGLALFQHP